MKVEALHVGMKVKHPQYGIGTVRVIAEHTAEVRFDDLQRTISPDNSGLEAAEPQIAVTGLDQPLALFVEETVRKVVRELGLEKADGILELLCLLTTNSLQPGYASFRTKLAQQFGNRLRVSVDAPEGLGAFTEHAP